MEKYKINTVKIRSIIQILLLCLYISASAQSDSLNIKTTTQPVRGKVDFRIPDKNKIEEYKKDSRFDYKPVERDTSAWDKIKYWFYDLLGDTFSAVSRSGIAGIVVLVIIVIVLCLIVLKVLGVDYRTVLGKKKIDTPEIDIYTENVHEMDFDTLISNAMKNKDYRLVVRFLYLKNLKQLSDKEIIDWKANKTNYSYQHEISNSALRSKFLESTLIFDYVWYGEFSLNELQFSDIYGRMDEFNKMIAHER